MYVLTHTTLLYYYVALLMSFIFVSAGYRDRVVNYKEDSKIEENMKVLTPALTSFQYYP